jgi:hypothetical protein
LQKKYPEILKTVESSGKIEDDLKAKIDKALTEFEGVFTA